jgi:predicted nuclease with TOPRIM domain
MSDLQPYIVRIANKLKLLLKQQEQLRKENERLRSGISSKESELASIKENMLHLEEKLSVMKASAGNMEDKSRLDFEKKINQYIKDIDKVIVHLNG